MLGTTDERKAMKDGYQVFAHLKQEGDGIREQMNEGLKELAKVLELDVVKLRTAYAERYNIEAGKKAKIEGASELLLQLDEAIEGNN